MKSYVGTKIINAEPMTAREFEDKYGKKSGTKLTTDVVYGYHVVYGNKEGEYHSWSPKDVFEEAYRPISAGEQLLVKNLIN